MKGVCFISYSHNLEQDEHFVCMTPPFEARDVTVLEIQPRNGNRSAVKLLTRLPDLHIARSSWS